MLDTAKNETRPHFLALVVLGTWLQGQAAPQQVEWIYTGEVFTNMRGGIDTNDATEYRGNLDLTITADLDEMGFAPGGTFFIYAQNGHGRGITDRYVGDFQVLSNIDAPDFMQVSEYWWDRELFDRLISVQLGKQDVNSRFAVMEMAADFINSSFGFHPTIPMPSFPDPSMAAAVSLRLTDRLSFEAGVWDGAPNGRNWGLSGTGTTFSICELSFDYALGRRDELPGQFHFGPWYHSDRFDDPAPGSTASFSGNHGIHCEMQQALFAERQGDHGNHQGLGAFAQYGWAPGDRNEAHQYVGGGLIYRGLILGRGDDVLGAGVAHLIFSDRLPNQAAETAVELFYKARLTPRAVLQPDLQYIAHPGGRHRDAFAFGLRFEVAL